MKNPKFTVSALRNAQRDGLGIDDWMNVQFQKFFEFVQRYGPNSLEQFTEETIDIAGAGTTQLPFSLFAQTFHFDISPAAGDYEHNVILPSGRNLHLLRNAKVLIYFNDAVSEAQIHVRNQDNSLIFTKFYDNVTPDNELIVLTFIDEQWKI